MAAPAAAAQPPSLPVATAVLAPVPAAFVLPMDDLQRIAEGSGLTWVNSDADKMRAAQAAMAAEPAAMHVPRQRPPLLPLDDGPLVLVETRKSLAQLKLPFDTGNAAGTSASTPPSSAPPQA